MLHKTRGIVFKTTNYGESSVIVQVYTEKFGLQSYIINGVKKPRAKINRNMLQPLFLLDMVVYNKPGGGIQRVSELKNEPLLQSIPYDVIKTSIVMFLNEVLYKAVKHQATDENLFGFIFHAIELLEHQQEGLANFHLLFLLKLTRYMGFYPEVNQNINADFFDLKEGVFKRYKPEHTLYLSPPHTQSFNMLLQYSFEDMTALRIGNDERRYLINKLLEYYALHIENFGDVHSHEILEEVLG
ncbi:DNA repair protein RecO [Mucilaginibacter sp. HMF5004]|uniref:DNA repair protein RecO n=1 Tax=Mucilaginibacter rivuli TaxID=2857527 RepID=UPI001C5F3A5A|nr:DNA repair protein RecO [Mucilaginibacter rivuli]MBW4891105.1 DNA repair protein RecO [Mucilaginibacter rivuli]